MFVQVAWSSILNTFFGKKPISTLLNILSWSVLLLACIMWPFLLRPIYRSRIERMCIISKNKSYFNKHWTLKMWRNLMNMSKSLKDYFGVYITEENLAILISHMSKSLSGTIISRLHHYWQLHWWHFQKNETETWRKIIHGWSLEFGLKYCRFSRFPKTTQSQTLKWLHLHTVW